jgi:hypothetical protein
MPRSGRAPLSTEWAVSRPVSPGKLRHRGQGTTAPMPGLPLNAVKLTDFATLCIGSQPGGQGFDPPPLHGLRIRIVCGLLVARQPAARLAMLAIHDGERARAKAELQLADLH